MSEHHESHENLEAQKQQEWEKQSAIYQKIEAAGGMQAYIESLPDIENAFKLKDRVLRCIDEGTQDGLHSPGCCILSQDRAKTIEQLKKANLDGISSHAGCGAAALAAKDSGMDPEEYAKQWSKQLAEDVGVPYVGHLEVARPSFHNARAAYYDGTGTFNAAAVPGMPIGFHISRSIFDDAESASEALATKIAAGDHGYGAARFTAEAPFYLIPVADANNPELSLEKLTAELEEIAAASEGKIKIMGFTRPEEKAVEQAA